MQSDPDSRSARKRRAILAAATTVFLSKGYDGTSMDDVAALAGVSKPTVYNHFADKERLFTEIILATTDHATNIVPVVTDTVSDTADFETDLNAFARQFVTALMQPQVLRLRRLVIANADRFPDVGRTWYEQGFERALAALAAWFQLLADRNLLWLDDPLLAANHFVGLLLWIPVNEAMFKGIRQAASDAELHRYADAAVRAFLAGYGRPSLARSPGLVRGRRSAAGSRAC